MKKLKLFALAALALVGYAGVANAADATMLAQDDFVGISFWIISMGMLAATAFFFMERGTVNPAENISNCCRSCNWYCFHSLHVHERSMGCYR